MYGRRYQDNDNLKEDVHIKEWVFRIHKRMSFYTIIIILQKDIEMNIMLGRKIEAASAKQNMSFQARQNPARL